MKAVASDLLNGRATGVKALVTKKLLHAASSSNHWSSSENNQTNAWNVNFSNGNFNNNNKYNSYVVRAVSASDEEIASWVQAFYDCCKHKRTGTQCTLYRMYMETDLPFLATEVKERVYQPTTSTCFVVTRPKLREVFAANFRDRIVQHWLCARIEPLFEARFQSQRNVSYNCRPDFGTMAAVQRLSSEMSAVSEGYTKEAYIGKFDIQGFFMHIDCTVLEQLMIPFIEENYKGNDIDTVLYLARIIIRHEPQTNCKRKGDVTLWDQLEKHKSLFYAEPNIGMPIGNLTSQLFANFYMSFLDEYMLTLCDQCDGKYVRFVDDFCIVAPRKEDVIRLYHEADWFLSEKLHLTLHKDKFYLQEVKKGVKFVGSVIKQNRIYLSNRTVGNMYNAIIAVEKLCERCAVYDEKIELNYRMLLERAACSINSYFGFLVHCNSYNLRSKLFKHSPNFWRFFYIEGHFCVAKLKEKYKPLTFLLEQDKNDLKIAETQWK